MVEQTVAHWKSTVEQLEAALASPDTSGASSTGDEGWRAYSDIISPVRDEYHELFPLSTDALPDADRSIEEMLLSGEYEYLETEEGYIILSRRIPVPTSKDGPFISRRRKVLRHLLAGQGARSNASGMRGLLMWDCSRRRSQLIGDHSTRQKKQRPSRALSFRRMATRKAETDAI